MAILIDGSIKDVWVSYKYGQADDYFTSQFNSLMQICSGNDTLPFFDHVKKDPPENGLNRTIMVDINKSAAELHAAAIGAKENIYIYGKDARDLGLTLDTKKNIQPLLVASIHKYGSDRLSLDEMNVAESGAKEKYQFMYNIEQFDERSQQIFKKITKERQQPEFKKERLQNQNKAVSLYKENLTIPKNKDKVLSLLQENRNETSSNNTHSIFNAILIHNIAQAQGGFDVIGKKYTETANEIVAKQKMREEINNVVKLIGDDKLPKDILMRSAFKGQRTATLLVSKDVSLEQRHQKLDREKAKTNTHKLEYGFSR